MIRGPIFFPLALEDLNVCSAADCTDMQLMCSPSTVLLKLAVQVLPLDCRMDWVFCYRVLRLYMKSI